MLNTHEVTLNSPLSTIYLSTSHTCSVLYTFQPHTLVLYCTLANLTHFFYTIHLSTSHTCSVLYTCQSHTLVLYYTLVNLTHLFCTVHLSTSHTCSVLCTCQPHTSSHTNNIHILCMFTLSTPRTKL